MSIAHEAWNAAYFLGLAKGRKEGMGVAAGLLLERAGKCKEPYANGSIPTDIRAVINILARIAQDIKKQSGIPANHEIYEERISNLKAALSEIVSDQNDFCTTCEEHIDTAADALNRDAIRQAAQGGDDKNHTEDVRGMVQTADRTAGGECK